MRTSFFAVVALVAAAGASADTKISALPAGSTLAGTEQIPAVQGGATVATNPAALAAYAQSVTGGRTATMTLCAPDTVGQPAGCDTVVHASAAQNDINPLIASCNASLRTSFSGSTSGTALTVTSAVTGTPIYIGEPLEYAGDNNAIFVVSGSGTSWTLSQVPSGTPTAFTGPWPQCTIRLRTGHYYLSGTIVIDRSGITLMGEGWPGGLEGRQTSYLSTTTTPIGAIGIASTIVQVGSGYIAIQEQTTNIPDVGDSFHHDNAIVGLYVVGSGTTPPYADTGISFPSANPSEACSIEYNFVQRFSTAVKGGCDGGWIFHNYIRDNGSYCMDNTGGNHNKIIANTCEDNGNGILGNDVSSIYSANRVVGGGTGSISFTCGGTNMSVTLNKFSLPADHAVTLASGCTNLEFTDNQFLYNTTNRGTRTTAAVQCAVSSSATGIVSGNLFNNAAGNEAAGVYAMDMANCGSTLFVNGNAITGGWNNNTQPFIHYVAGNGVLGSNSGDTLSGFGVPTIVSGFGTSPSVSGANQGYRSFAVNVGTGGTASSGVIGLPTTPNSWSCAAADGGATPTGSTQVSATGASSVTVTNYSRTTGSPVAWTASELIQLNCAWN